MQNITPNMENSSPVIQSYGPAGFRIGGVDYISSVLVTPDAVTKVDLQSIEQLTAELFAPLTTLHPPLEALLIGTGAKHAFLATDLRAQLKAQGLNPDAMATGAACRTFNILLSEDRRVATLLLLPQ